MSEQEKWHPSMEQQIEAKFGKEILEETASVGQAIFKEVQKGVANIGLREGSSEEQKREVETYLAMWHDFANNLFARTSSENLKSPETITTAIEGANALMSPEPLREKDAAAKKMIDALGHRYGQ